MSGAAIVMANPPSSSFAPPAWTAFVAKLKAGKKEALFAPAFKKPPLNAMEFVCEVFVLANPPTVNVPPLSRTKVTAVVRLTFWTSRLFAPHESTALFCTVRVTLPPACPPPRLHTPSVMTALSRIVTLALRLPPLVSRPKATAPPVALTTALDAN